MSLQITQELRHLGVAQVIVVLKPAGTAAAAAAPVVSALKKHFVTSERSHSSALAVAAGKRPSSVPPMRHYKNLGVILGTVDRDGLTALRADKNRVASVIGAPPLSLIRPERVAAAKLTTKVTWGIGGGLCYGGRRVKTDPELLRQLEARAASQEPVQAVFYLRPAQSSEKALPPNQVEELAQTLLDRVERSVGVGAEDVNVFRHLSSFVVSASPAFVKELLQQPEIASAMANRQPSLEPIRDARRRRL